MNFWEMIQRHFGCINLFIQYTGSICKNFTITDLSSIIENITSSINNELHEESILKYINYQILCCLLFASNKFIDSNLYKHYIIVAIS